MPRISRSETDSSSRKEHYWTMTVLILAAVLYTMSAQSQSTTGTNTVTSGASK